MDEWSGRQGPYSVRSHPTFGSGPFRRRSTRLTRAMIIRGRSSQSRRRCFRKSLEANPSKPVNRLITNSSQLGLSLRVKAKPMAQIFHPGEKVMLFYGYGDRGGTSIYEVVRALPASAEDERQYQVRGPQGYHRVIGEGQIRFRLHEADALAAGAVGNQRRREPGPAQGGATRTAAVTLAGAKGFAPLRTAG